MKRVSLVIPCRNEAEHLEVILSEVPSLVDEIILVNNQSTDNTLAVMHRLSRKDKRIVVINETRQKQGIGYGYACITGMMAAKGDYIICADGDGTYPLGDIEAFIARAQDYDLVVGDRYAGPLKGHLSFPWLGTWLLSVGAAVLFGRRINDIVSGMWLVHSSALKKLQLKEGGWNLSLEIKLKTLTHPSLCLVELPIKATNRFGATKQNYLKTGIQHAWWLIRYRGAMAGRK